MKRTLLPEEYEKPRRRSGKGSKEKEQPLSKLAQDKGRLSQVCRALPHSTEYAATENEDDDDMEESDSEEDDADKELTDRNARRKAKGQINKVKRGKTSRSPTMNNARHERVTRSMEKAKQAKSETARRKSDPGGRGSKRKKLNMDDIELEEGEILETVAGSENTFDLFNSDEPKQDWDTHPKMAELMKNGKERLEKVGGKEKSGRVGGAPGQHRQQPDGRADQQGCAGAAAAGGGAERALCAGAVRARCGACRWRR